VVLACVLAERGGRVDLVERIAKKAAFLREALRVTGARGEVFPKDIGDYVDSSQQQPDCVTARALAPLHLLLGYVEPLVRQGAKALLLKGQDVESELTEATKYWKITPVLHRSRSGGEGWIVEINHIEAVAPH
jgi:16S rRNA (guanine527-N7)-methyltransferase